jgi:hypothetical protein
MFYWLLDRREKMIREGTWVVAVTAALMSCGDHGHTESHKMAFAFEPGLRLPTAYSSLEDDGATLKVTTTMQMGTMEHDLSAAFEPLQEGAGYRVWALKGGTWADLGAFEPGTGFEATVDSPEAVSITIETSEAPKTRSADVVVEGDAGGTLTFGDLGATSFTPAAIEAEISEDTVTVDYTGLPALPGGFQYQVWYVPAGEGGEAAGDAVSLGTLEGAGDGSLVAEDVSWPGSYFLSISIESPEGAAGRSALTCYVAEHEDSASGTGGHGH